MGSVLSVFKDDTIQGQHDSDEEACLKAVIEAFLHGEGHYQPSWRRVIHALYHAKETRIAQDIISYAEPVEGERQSHCILTPWLAPPVRGYGMKLSPDRVYS